MRPERVEFYARIFGPDAPPLPEVDLDTIGVPVIALSCAHCGAEPWHPCRGVSARTSHGVRALTSDHLEQVDIWLDISADFSPDGPRPPLAPADPDLRYVCEPDNPFRVRYERDAGLMLLNVPRLLHPVYLGGMPERLALDFACGCLIAASRTPAPESHGDNPELIGMHLASLAHVGISGVVDEYLYEQEQLAS